MASGGPGRLRTGGGERRLALGPLTGNERRAGAAVAGVLAAAALLWGVPAQAATIRQQQWQLDFLHAAQANRYSTGQGVIVGLVDTGVSATHPDLVGRVLPGTDNPPSGTRGLKDVDGHGTLMAGLIAADGAARGLAPGVKILSGRAGLRGDATQADVVIRWEVDHGAKVLNLSFGSDIRLEKLAEAVAYAQGKDVVVVAAAGNTSQDDRVAWPAALPGVVAVSAVDNRGAFARKVSVSGAKVVIAAPGVDLVGPSLGKGYIKASGTSGSAALVSATAALVRSRYPKLNAAGVINRLIATADDRGPKGRDPQYGFGIVDPVRALTAKVAAVTTNPLLPAGAPASAATASPSSGAVPAASEGAETSAGDVAAAKAAAAAAAAKVAATEPAEASAAGSEKSSSSGLVLAAGSVFLALAALAVWFVFRRRSRV